MHPSNSWQGQKTTPVENAQQRRAHFQRCKKGNGERSTSVAPGIVRPSGGNVLFRNKTFHAQKGRDVGTFIPGVASMANILVNRDVKSASRPQHQVVASVGQCNVPPSMSDTQSDTQRVSSHRMRTRWSRTQQTSEVCGVVATRCSS